MLFVQSPSLDAYFNMALEEYFFTSVKEECLILWRNGNAVVVGKYQNTAQEINAAYVRENGVAVVRRLSGGGAVYQDAGNINYTVIVNRAVEAGTDFRSFTEPVVSSLRVLGVLAGNSGRNDLVVAGRKISGSAQYSKGGRTLHHGTLLFDSDLDAMEASLNAAPDKIELKGIKSVRDRVANIRDHLEADMDIVGFMAYMREYLSKAYETTPYVPDDSDISAIERLARDKYSKFEWNYGESPPCVIYRECRFEAGSVTVYINVVGGIIRSVKFTGDFFAGDNVETLSSILTGLPLTREALSPVLLSSRARKYIYGVNNEELVGLLVD